MGQSSQIAAQFLAIDAFLYWHRGLWAPQPFHEPSPPWMEQFPELARALLAWTPAQAQAAEADPQAQPAALRALHAESEALCVLPRFEGPAASPPARVTRGITGRKLTQVLAFCGVAAPRLQTPEVADWCAGKAHLSRTLAQATGAAVHSYEVDPALCLKAEALALAQKVRLQAHPTDLLQPPPALPAQATLIALHACGELSDRALDAAAQQALPALFVAPCCHHKRRSKHYAPRSRLATTQARLDGLCQNALRLSTARVLVATRRKQRIRENKMRFRVAYRSLIPGTFRSGPESWFTRDFGHFATQLSAREGHVLPPYDPPALLAQAQAEVERARALGVVRTPFRRPLELWLNLDRALALEEAGWQVRVGRFCSESVSPRDILISAHRGS